MNVAYSVKLKHVPYIDVSCISLGFVLRVLGGGLATRLFSLSFFWLGLTTDFIDEPPAAAAAAEMPGAAAEI